MFLPWHARTIVALSVHSPSLGYDYSFSALISIDERIFGGFLFLLDLRFFSSFLYRNFLFLRSFSPYFPGDPTPPSNPPPLLLLYFYVIATMCRFIIQSPVTFGER